MGNKKNQKAKRTLGLSRFAQLLEDQAVQIYSTIAAALFALNGFFFSLHRIAGVIDILLAVAFFILSLRGTARVRRSYRTLITSIHVLDGRLAKQREALKSYLQYLVESLANGELGFKQTERISVFEITDNGFELVARFSTNPEVCKPTRTQFPLDYGIISAAFKSEEGEAYDFKLPDPEQDFEAYANEQNERWQVPKTHLKKMKMKPREYAAFVVRNKVNNQVSGVILFESTHKGKLLKETTRKAAKSAQAVEIGNLLGFADVGE